MKRNQIFLGLGMIGLGIFIDQITKIITFQYLKPNTIYPGIPGLFRFSLVKNTGAAWGIFDNQIVFFIIITIVALGFLLYLGKDFDLKTKPIYSAALILILVGTIGNFIDRVSLRYVRDFVTFDFISFPSFNFADMCLTVGVIALAFDILFGETGTRWTKN